MSARVALRPFRPEELDVAIARRGAVARAAELRERWKHSGTMRDGWLEFAIEVDGRLAGDVQARGSNAQYWPEGVFELGIILYDTGDRGRGAGTEAVRLITDRLFDEHGAGRVQASTAVDNLAMRRALEKCGFRLEGVLRSFMPGANGREDYALYAITGDDRSER